MKNLVSKIISWIGADGGAHINICILVSSIMAILVNVYVGVIFTALLGIVKEVNDIKHGDTWKNSVHDLICDTIGIALGVFIYFVWHLNL